MSYYRFDFGNVPAKVDFLKITEKTVYTDERNYGLTNEAKSLERKTGENPLCRDFLLMADNGFKVKIPQGLYHVRVLTGDYEDKGDVYALDDKGFMSEAAARNMMSVNGQQFKMRTRDRSIFVGEYIVDNETGMLDFKFEGPYVCVSAIEVEPFHDAVVDGLKAEVHASEKDSHVCLSFNPVDFASGYAIYRKKASDHEFEPYAKVKDNHFTDTNVELCETYYYLVNALDELSFKTVDGQPLEVTVVDGCAKPQAPGKLSTEVSADSVRLSYESVTGALGYYIYQKPPYGLYKKIGTTKECSYLHAGVNTSVEYIYAVEAVTTSGLSPKATVATPKVAEKLKRHMETLDRGLVAMKTTDGIFLGWRLNAYEYGKGIDFHLFRNGIKITDKPVADSTNYFDKDGKADDTYTVKAIKNGKIEKDGYSAKVINADYLSIPLDKPAPHTTPDGQIHEYIANDVEVADLDGDGEYEIVLKWDAGSHDNSHLGYTGLVYLDAYKLSGKMLWRIDLGVNIRAGAHYTQFLVYDFDSDGKAEVIFKTADGTTDAKGNAIGDKNADYRNSTGFIIEGPEYLSVFDGETGELLDTVDYDPPRGNVADWGDSWGNRVDRFLACVAYLDGVNPSAVMCRGYYGRGKPTVLVAYDLVNKKLVKRWKFFADKDHDIDYTDQGNHNLAVGDVDGDGCDEIVYGACVIDHDGTGVYSTGFGHGDAMHLGKFDPRTEGLDFYQIHEELVAEYGFEVRNPATGEVYWGYQTGRDTGRGLVANIDPRYEGCEVWAKDAALYTFDGKVITENSPKAINFAIWWDGDLQRELLDQKWQGGDFETCGIGQIYKWDYENSKMKVLLDSKDAYTNNGTKGNPCIQADIFGDWREEVIWRNEKSTELRVYTTTHLTDHKFYTLMHDPLYRLGVAWQNTAYNQPPHTGFYIGGSMKEPPVPDNSYVNGENTADRCLD